MSSCRFENYCVWVSNNERLLSTEGRSIFIGQDCRYSNDIEIRDSDGHCIVKANSRNTRTISWGGRYLKSCMDVRILKTWKCLIIALLLTVLLLLSHWKSLMLFMGKSCRFLKGNIDWKKVATIKHEVFDYHTSL